MSRTYSADPIADAPDLEAALATLRSHGMRASAARRLVLEALYLAGEPVTVEDIAGGLDGRLPASDPGSVYRNLEALEAIGLVRHVHVGHAPGRYVTASAGVREHLLCDACGALRAVEPEGAGRRARADPRRASATRRASRTSRSAGCAPRARGRVRAARRTTASGSRMHIPDGFLSRRRGRGHGRRRGAAVVLRAAPGRPGPRRAAGPAARRDRRVRVRRADAQLPGGGRHQRALPRGGAGGDPARAVARLPRDRGGARRRRRSCSPTGASRRSGPTSSTWAWSARCGSAADARGAAARAAAAPHGVPRAGRRSAHGWR